MPDFSGKPINKSIFVDSCDVSVGKFSPQIKPEEAAGVKFTCQNKFRQNIVTCKDDSIDLFINEVDGLEFNVSLKTHLTGLPNYIPIIDYCTARTIRLPDSIRFIGVSLKDIIKSGFLSKAGRIHESKNITYRKDLFASDIFKGKKIILFNTGPDTYIEGVWRNRNLSLFFDALKSMNIYAATGFNFSVFGEECAFSQILNLKRSLYSSHLLEQNNIKCIPHVYALNQFQVKRWIDFFKLNSSIEYITMNCQFQKSKKKNTDLIETIKFILYELPHLHIILQGFPFTQIYNFGYFLSRIHFAEKKAIKYAFGYKELNFDRHRNLNLLPNQSKIMQKANSSDLVIPNIIDRRKQLKCIVEATLR